LSKFFDLQFVYKKQITCEIIVKHTNWTQMQQKKFNCQAIYSLQKNIFLLIMFNEFQKGLLINFLLSKQSNHVICNQNTSY